jgi:hypothetical protein
MPIFQIILGVGAQHFILSLLIETQPLCLLDCFLLVRLSIAPTHFHGFYAQIIAYQLAEAPKRVFRPLLTEVGAVGPQSREVGAAGPQSREVGAAGPQSREVGDAGPQSREVGAIGPLFTQLTAIGPMFTEARAIEAMLNDSATLTVDLNIMALLDVLRHHGFMEHVKEDSHPDADANDGHLSDDKAAINAHSVNEINLATESNDVQ